MNPHLALRLTPSNSPFLKNSAPRSPTKVNRNEEPGLRLNKVIGTTVTSVNGFDCLPSQKAFAYTAGAAAVVATVQDDLKITQRFFKARPTLLAAGRETYGQSLTSPASTEARNRAFGGLREQSNGASPLSSARDWSDSPTGRSTTAKDRVKAATSVALSPNGKWVAVGETGYKPRILIFSLAEEASDTPVAVLSEHTFGVHALSFSPDSKFLASLGTVNDGFLYLWRVDDRSGNATLHASNKCTALINCMSWVGPSLVTVGLRFVKVWRPDLENTVETRVGEATLSPLTPRHRPENRSSDFGNSILSPKHKVLAGKNTLLGDVLDCNFVSLRPVSEAEAIICADTGEICLLSDVAQGQNLRVVAHADFRISAARLDDTNSLFVLGDGQQMSRFALSDLRNDAAAGPSGLNRRRTTILPAMQSSRITNSTVATANIGGIVLRLDAGGSIELSTDLHEEGSRLSKISGHTDALSGVLPISSPDSPNAAYLTFSGNGMIQTWDAQGESLRMLTAPLDSSQDHYGLTDTLTAVAPLAHGSLLATGDRFGMLSIQVVATGSVLTQLRAHSAEITDICALRYLESEMLATASRDRTIQLFLWSHDRLKLLQTLDEHAGAVTGLLTTDNGRQLLSCSADRSVVVREAWLRDESNPASVAFVVLRTIALKSAPTSMCIGTDASTIFVATMDRAIAKYSTRSGQAIMTFKCSDSEGGEAAVLSSIQFAPSLNGIPTIVGVSSSDKSLRLYSETGTLIARDWGHTEGVTGVALLVAAQQTSGEQQAVTQIITVAADSTIFLWDTTPTVTSASQQELTNGASELSTPTKAASMGPPLRKVISYAELSRFRRESSLEEGESTSPTSLQTPTQPSSPHRLRKKPSRMSVAQAPRLEPAFRASFAEPSSSKSSRRQSLRQRSPSPPSPRTATKRDHIRRPSLGMSLRSKSTDNVLNAPSSSAPSGFGSLTASTESVCRTLRAYRKKLAGASTSDSFTPEALRELEKELKLTARVLSEKSQGKTLDEAMMARLLDQASEKIVGMLDERIKDRVESEVRRSTEGSPLSMSLSQPVPMDDEQGDALAGALEKVVLEG